MIFAFLSHSVSENSALLTVFLKLPLSSNFLPPFSSLLLAANGGPCDCNRQRSRAPCARQRMAGDRTSRFAVFLPHARQNPGLYGHRCPDARIGDWRQHRDFHPARSSSAAPPSG